MKMNLILQVKLAEENINLRKPNWTGKSAIHYGVR